ncbi:hypothetical protein [Methylotenera sp. 1P/1]|uniref:hypothetical protein n=1 Tax=Methylotenera sp. 1P/1 TaxID=1131551 RepID=UPI00037D8632|nr:hypothetical protein [Methylotenera sp. 1P/1]
MKHNFNSVTLQIRLLILTALISVLGLAVFSHYSEKTSYSDDTARVRVAEIQEISGDGELPQYDGYTPAAILSSVLILSIKTFITLVLFRSKRIARYSFLHHIRPRSPPL